MRIFILLLAFALAAGAATAQDTRRAELSVEGDSVCNHNGTLDHQVSTETYVLALPEMSGPVSAEGSYVNTGTGYTLTGISKVAGEVRDDAELVLTHLQWNFNGEWMFSTAPFAPTAGLPVVIPLDPGGETTVRFVNAMPVGQAPCTGHITYRISFERETQVWDVALKAERLALHRNLYGLTDTETGAWSTFYYKHGVTFRYDLAARITLEKRKGAWSWRDGQVTRASVSHDYQQDPPLYTIKATSCSGCDRVAGLVGAALSGESDGSTLRLFWPNIRPVVDIDSVFAAACAPGPRQASCERLKRDGSRFSAEDDDTLQRAAGQVLRLAPGPQRFTPGSTTGATKLTLRFDYTLTRVK